MTSAAKQRGFLIRDVISCARHIREGREFSCIVVSGGYEVLEEAVHESAA